MNWSDIGRQLIALGAPLLGTALAGPLGNAAGQVLAEALGAPSALPADVQASLPNAPSSAISDAENRWIEIVRAEAETQRAAINETQRTIRTEIGADDVVQRWWRPFYAFELTIECAALWSVLVHDFWKGEVRTVNALIGAAALLIAYWGFRFGVLGVYVGGRTREKQSALTGEIAPGAIEQLIRILVKKKP
jgi:hypothetical protein